MLNYNVMVSSTKNGDFHVLELSIMNRHLFAADVVCNSNEDDILTITELGRYVQAKLGSSICLRLLVRMI